MRPPENAGDLSVPRAATRKISRSRTPLCHRSIPRRKRVHAGTANDQSNWGSVYNRMKHLAWPSARSIFTLQSSPFLISSARKISSLPNTMLSASLRAFAADACWLLWLRNTVVMLHFDLMSDILHRLPQIATVSGEPKVAQQKHCRRRYR